MVEYPFFFEPEDIVVGIFEILSRIHIPHDFEILVIDTDYSVFFVHGCFINQIKESGDFLPRIRYL
jgi:hypothetical protein